MSENKNDYANWCDEARSSESKFFENGKTDVKGPHLIFVERPQTSIRFRYLSEKNSAPNKPGHGALNGVNTPLNSRKHKKTYPEVQLVNYDQEAVVTVQLYQDTKEALHPADEYLGAAKKKQVLRQGGSHIASFKEIDVTVVKKEDFLKWCEKHKIQDRKACKPDSIDKHCVRLRFAAHTMTGDEICPPLYSEPIRDSRINPKLKIVDYKPYRLTGDSRDLWIAVDGITHKDNIELEFYKEGADEPFAIISHSNLKLHKLALIITEFPVYKSPIVPGNKYMQVRFALHRINDGQRSEARTLEYQLEAGQRTQSNKRTFSSRSSSTTDMAPYSKMKSRATSLSESDSKVPRTPGIMSECSTEEMYPDDLFGIGLAQLNKTYIPIDQHSQSDPVILETIVLSESEDDQDNHMLNEELASSPLINKDPLLSQTSAVSYPEYQHQPDVVHMDLDTDTFDIEDIARSLLQNSYPLVPDSANHKIVNLSITECLSSATRKEHPSKNGEVMKPMKNSVLHSAIGNEIISKALTEIRNRVKQGIERNREKISNKIEDLFEIRCPNGDTSLHTTLLGCQTSFKKLFSQIHSMGLSHLLKTSNNQGQSILHLAVENSLPQTVNMFVDHGCEVSSPLSNQGVTVRDTQCRTPLHYAVIQDQIDAIAQILRFCTTDKIDAIDSEGLTALQLACMRSQPNRLAIVSLLLKHKNEETISHHPLDEDLNLFIDISLLFLFLYVLYFMCMIY